MMLLRNLKKVWWKGGGAQLSHFGASEVRGDLDFTQFGDVALSGQIWISALHNSLVCIEFWHKFLDYDLAINFLKFVFVRPLCYILSFSIFLFFIFSSDVSFFVLFKVLSILLIFCILCLS